MIIIMKISEDSPECHLVCRHQVKTEWHRSKPAKRLQHQRYHLGQEVNQTMTSSSL